MANRFSGIISGQLKKLFTDAINGILEESALTVPCKLIYEGKMVVCSNCQINPVTGKSSGVYKTGGPIPFTNKICPYCSGEGKKTLDTDETIHMCLVWDYKSWKNMGFNIESPDGYCVSLCNVSLLPKIKRAKCIILNTDVEDYKRHKFTRNGEPNPMGCCVGDEMFIATLWKRTE